MCGISGIIGHWREPDLEAAQRLNNSLRHRGPDDAGSWRTPQGQYGAILNHRRLSIIDLRSIAAQPIISASTGNVLVFNGEIYNYRELRDQLRSTGRTFVTDGDSEVILNGYDEWGVKIIPKLRGMFAFALFDAVARRAILARDGFGIKPLYWSKIHDPGRCRGIAFASESRSLVQAGYADTRTDRTRVANYLWNGFCPGPETIWSEVHELPRGSYAVLDEAQPTPRPVRYWAVGSAPRTAVGIGRSEADEIIRETVRAHLAADVAKVVFLSGGVDSTAVAALAAGGGARLQTISIGFEASAADETPFSRVAAEALGTDHSAVMLDGTTVQVELEQALIALDQPSFDGFNTWFVSREAAGLGFKVALSGAGGDELVGGYASFKRLRMARRLAGIPALPALMGGVASRFASRLENSKWVEAAQGMGSVARFYQAQYALFSKATIGTLMDAPEALDPWGLNPGRLADLTQRTSGLSAFRATTLLESELFLGDRLLRDMDSASMAHSLEVRVPLVDTKLSDRLDQMGESDRYLPLGKKGLLRRQAEEVLPAGFFERRKQGFEFPMDAWMRGPLRTLIEAQLLDPSRCADLALKPAAVERIWRLFLASPGAIYWTRPWAIFSLLRWASYHNLRCS
jgi:asparagine synthase (glutamine-hydrolysing)